MNNFEEQKKRILTLMENKVEKDLDEAGFARVLNTLRGFVPSIKTIAILTAQNPKGEQASPEYNKSANEKLVRNFIEGKFSYRPVKGKYGNTEDSFMINNISKDDAINIGKKFDQDSIVFGERIEKDGYIGVNFKMIRTSPNKEGGQIGDVMGEKDVFVNLDNPEDYYTEVKGRKFIIPFYGVTDILKKDAKIEGDKDKERYREYEDVKWDNGKAIPSTRTITDIEEINKLTEQIIRTSGSSSYNYRGMLNQKLRKLGLI